MFARMGVFASLCLLLSLIAVVPAAGAAATCTPTGFYRDSINMTAAVINPTGKVAGTINATGCNIGVYYDRGTKGLVSGAEIFGANYFGVLVNGDDNAVAVDIVNSRIHDIGERPLNGTQHGVAIYYRAFGAGSASGKIRGNTIFNYQKGGITANGTRAAVDVSDNIVTGQGAVGYIAQNGIQIGYGASASVMRNTVTGNSYTGPYYASGGILVVGGPGYGGDYTANTQIVGNTVVNNDVGIYLSNYAADYSAPPSATNIKVVNNTIHSDGVYNSVYQAGVSDVGNNDKIVANTISGSGYDPTSAAWVYAIDADASFTNRAKVHANR